MGQENSSTFNCGVWEKDNKHEVRGDQAMKIRKMLEQEKNRFQTPSRDYESSTGASTASRQKSLPPLLPPTQLHNSLLIEHENILRLTKEPTPRYSKTEFGFYEPADISVASLVESRYNTKMLFPEDQVWKLAEAMLYAIAYLERRKFRHHDVYPTHIFYTAGTFKLSHPKMATSSYDLTRQRKRFSFLSPELIISLREDIDKIEPQILYKSDIFSLGMTLLEFCSLRPSCQVYDQDNYDIIDSVILDRLEAIKQTYSPEVAQLIAAMLEYEEEHRPTAYKLAQIVNQHARQIMMQQSTKRQAQMSRVVVQPAGQAMYGTSQVIHGATQQGPHGLPPGIPQQCIAPGVSNNLPQNINPLTTNSVPPNIQQELMRLQQQGFSVVLQSPSKLQQPQYQQPSQPLTQQPPQYSQPPPGYLVRPHSPRAPDQPSMPSAGRIQPNRSPEPEGIPAEPIMQQPSQRPPIDSKTETPSRDNLQPTTFNFKDFMNSDNSQQKNVQILTTKVQSHNYISHSSTNTFDAFEQRLNRIANDTNYKSESIGLIKPPQPSKDSEYYTSYAKKFDEQSLDERVRKILEKSRQIK